MTEYIINTLVFLLFKDWVLFLYSNVKLRNGRPKHDRIRLKPLDTNTTLGLILQISHFLF